MLRVQNLTKVFPKVKAVNELSFELDAGRVCGFIGPNGAGKTTAMRIIATLDNPTEGDVYIDGKSIMEEPYAIRRIIGFMPDHYGTYPDLMVRDYLEFYARAYEINPDLRDKRIDNIMDFTGLIKIADKQVESLSKGMRQRLNLGRALINDPSLMIMDEPAAGLDPRARVELRHLIKRLSERGKTIFVSSHILTELQEICDDILIIDRGKMVTFGDLSDIQRKMQKTLEINVTILDEDKMPALERFLLERKGVDNVRLMKNNTAAFVFMDGQDNVPGFISDMINSGLPVIEFRPRMMTMEDVFIQITEGEF